MPKIKTKILILCILTLILASFATATVEIVDSEVSLDVNYGNFNDDKQETITVTSNSFTIKNDGTENKTVTLEITGLPDKYETTPQEVTVNANDTLSTTIQIEVPHKENPGNKTIGMVVMKEADTQLDSANLIQSTASMLELEKIEVQYVNKKGGSEEDKFDDNDDDLTLQDEVQANSEIEILFKLENVFDNDYEDEGDIEDIKITIDANDDEIFPSDFEEEYDLGDLEADDKLEHTVKFIIDDEADDGSYTLEFTIEGEDTNGVEYKIEKELNLDIDLIKDDLRITKAEFTPTITTCDNSVMFDVNVKNFGKDDQDFASIVVSNSELGINENVKNFQIEEFGDSSDSWSKTFSFTLNKLQAKSYSFDVNLYIDNDKRMDNSIVKLDVAKCSTGTTTDTSTTDDQQTTDTTNTDTTTTTDQDTTIDTTTDTTSTTTTNDDTNQDTSTTSTSSGDQITSSFVVKSVEDPYTVDDVIIAIIIVSVVLIVAIIVLFIALLFR